MLIQHKPLMRVLRRSHTSVTASPAPADSSASQSTAMAASGSSSSSPWVHLRSVLFVATSSSSHSSSPLCGDRGNLKSPWSRRRRKHVLKPKQWKHLFDADGRLSDGGAKLLKKVRSGGVDPSIRSEVWPFLLGVYDVKSSKDERHTIKVQKRKEYVNLRRKCRQIIKQGEKSFKHKGSSGSGNINNEGSGDFSQVLDSPGLDEVSSARCSLSVDGASSACEDYDRSSSNLLTLRTSSTIAEEENDDDEEDDRSSVVNLTTISEGETESSDSDTSEELEDTKPLLGQHESEESDVDEQGESYFRKSVSMPRTQTVEDFSTWQRIIRLDAIRANSEWIIYSPSQAAVSEVKARRMAENVGLKDYNHLEPCKIFHAARLVAILEAYALFDSEIGYCQGMSDLLSPILSVMEKDHEAFWCFVGFMRKARHNFRLDEVGIRKQLAIVSKIIKCKDSHLYRHLEKLEAEDCFFVYRMVVVLFRRELNFEQTLCLWEVMWADQAAVRAGIAKSSWGRIRLRAPPTDDLLLYAIAAGVLQRRKQIIEKYSSMEEIMKECNSMAGQLDVWKLLDDAHDLVVTLHDKV
ncbi:hypothetical protein Leryth_005227 [Lithospermum erythrorhizon]|nr:hypothetical protein Leryth_005227 [Lithospermum erythrorhizon]